MDQVRRYTRDYLVYLRAQVGAHLDDGGELAEAYYVDQSPYKHLDTFEELATKNSPKLWKQNVGILSIVLCFIRFHMQFDATYTPDACNHVPDLLWRAPWPENKV